MIALTAGRYRVPHVHWAWECSVKMKSSMKLSTGRTVQYSCRQIRPVHTDRVPNGPDLDLKWRQLPARHHIRDRRRPVIVGRHIRRGKSIIRAKAVEHPIIMAATQKYQNDP